ncbi:MAG: tyrosine-type recombinase/integrase, partial [Lachnospiraceae bacterium]|nr:tyrosine-type recombinase/integrase [Lachnospiraceae bacterium]
MRKLMAYCKEQNITKELMIAYKEHLRRKGYCTSSINSFLVAANRFFDYMGWQDVKIKTFRLQKKVYLPEEKELTREEYKRLVRAAREQDRARMGMLLETICATGIRVGELRFLTVQSLTRGEIKIYHKGKERIVLLPKKLRLKLMIYVKKQGITAGSIFVTKNGAPMDRTYIWREMKKLCSLSGVPEEKVYPHNLRALFARTYYDLFKDIAKLADILGHSNIETTRIYIKTPYSEHRRQLDRMKLLVGQ